MPGEISRLSKTLKYYLFNNIALIISISVTDLLMNVILSEVCSKKYLKDFYETPRKNISFNLNITTCNRNYNNETDSRYDNMLWEDLLTRKSLTCLRYWKYRVCSISMNPTSNCFPISMKPNYDLNGTYLKTFSEPKSTTQNIIMLIYSSQTVEICLKLFEVTIKEMSICSIQRVKDHMIRIFPILIHSASVVELVRSPELRFAYGNSIFFYVSCLLAKSLFNVVVVSRVFMDYSHICRMIGKNNFRNFK